MNIFFREKEKFEKERERVNLERIKSQEETKENESSSSGNDTPTPGDEPRKPTTVIENPSYNTQSSLEDFSDKNTESHVTLSRTTSNQGVTTTTATEEPVMVSAV